jgi:hypothetical protein
MTAEFMFNFLNILKALIETSEDSGIPWNKIGLFIFSMDGFLMISIELFCYINIYHHLKTHNNEMMSGILDKNTIKKRNFTNAVSLTGLFVCWLVELFHLVFAGFLSLFIGNQWNREVSTFLRHLEFVLIPLIQIHTSPPIKRHLS